MEPDLVPLQLDGAGHAHGVPSEAGVQDMGTRRDTHQIRGGDAQETHQYPHAITMVVESGKCGHWNEQR